MAGFNNGRFRKEVRKHPPKSADVRRIDYETKQSDDWQLLPAFSLFLPRRELSGNSLANAFIFLPTVREQSPLGSRQRLSVSDLSDGLLSDELFHRNSLQLNMTRIGRKTSVTHDSYPAMKAADNLRKAG